MKPDYANHWDWHQKQAYRAWRRGVRWIRFRSFMAHWFWMLIALFIVAGALSLNYLPIGAR